MSNNYSVDDLVGWLSGKSKTHGWGAIVAYDRRKTNQLLHQLYVERFNSKSYLPLISETMIPAQHAKEHISGLQLSVPKLSFQNANLGQSKASLTMDIVGGMIMSEASGLGGLSYIYKIQKVVPIGGPQLSMTLDLHNSAGNVVANGEVIVDISAGEDFKANFVLGDLAPGEIGTRFKKIFSDLEDEQKVFPLGRLEGELNGALTPDGFDLRTMAAPGAKNRSSDNYGDGAVLMFVRLKGGVNGNFPGDNSDFKYLIPADKGGKEYTGTVLLASKVVMNNLIKAHVEPEVGRGLKLVPSSTSSDLAISLEASAGGWTVPPVNLSHQGHPSLSAKSLEPLIFNFNSTEPFTVSVATGGLLRFSWKGSETFRFHFTRHDMGWDPEEEDSDVHFEHSMEFFLKVELDPDTGVVTFVPVPGGTSAASVRKAPGEIDLYYTFQSQLEGAVSKLLNEMHTQLSRISMPLVDTFLIRNLLFPGQNAMRVQDALIPGDLALFCQIDPLRTSATVSPVNPIIEAGGSQQFSVKPLLAGVTWSVRGTEPGETNIGSIDAGGLYKAPPSESLPQGYQTVVVTAKGKLGGLDVSASAMISVLANTIALTPVFGVCDPGKTIQLTAETLQGVTPTWSLKNPAQGGALDAKGKVCTYTAGPLNPELADMFIDTIEVRNPANNAVVQAQILVLNRGLNLPVVVSKSSKPETGEVQLMLVFDDGPEMPVDGDVITALISGGGTVSASGLFKEPPNATGFAVISATVGSGTRGHRGFIVLPLPLTLYGDISRRVSDSLSENPSPSRQR